VNIPTGVVYYLEKHSGLIFCSKTTWRWYPGAKACRSLYMLWIMVYEVHWFVAVVTEICFYIGAKPLLAKPWFYKVVLKFWINYGGKLPLTGRMSDIMMWETRCMSSGFLLLNRYSDRGHQMDVWGIRLRFPVVGEGGEGVYFSCPQYSDRYWGTSSLLSHGYRGLFIRGVKQPGREADLSPPYNAPPRSMTSCCGA